MTMVAPSRAMVVIASPATGTITIGVSRAVTVLMLMFDVYSSYPLPLATVKCVRAFASDIHSKHNSGRSRLEAYN